jgi:polyisoprenoid-binding protein YceI
VYRIDPERSLLLMLVGRDGTLKNLGHDHVIASEDLAGFVLAADDASASRADLLMPLQSLIVDNAEYRTRFGLEPDVPASSIEGTTRNMQDKVLESALYPLAQVSARFASVYDEPKTLSVSITLHGTAFEYTVPVQLNIDPAELTAKGAMTIRHADFGLTPFSAAGGLLRVAEEIELSFELVAPRWRPAAETN